MGVHRDVSNHFPNRRLRDHIGENRVGGLANRNQLLGDISSLGAFLFILGSLTLLAPFAFQASTFQPCKFTKARFHACGAVVSVGAVSR
jgi:hypothetical protein